MRRSQGCGIVEFERPEEAANAITHLHLTEVSDALKFLGSTEVLSPLKA